MTNLVKILISQLVLKILTFHIFFSILNEIQYVDLFLLKILKSIHFSISLVFLLKLIKFWFFD